MNFPSKLYRYRSLNNAERELKALKESYLFSSSFANMNDPMEAFYETGGPTDTIFDALIANSGKKISDFYKLIREFIDALALISFSSRHDDLPMWAYYANNFSGMCLEFETSELFIGDLQHETLREVIYAKDALPPISANDLEGDKIKETLVARVTRKRIEWAHEKEWRFITAQVGPKYYLDDALSRIFLGPKIKQEHATKICSLLRDRPVEILQGKIEGFDLSFRTIKPRTNPAECESVGARNFNYEETFCSKNDLENYLTIPFEKLEQLCHGIHLRPNMEKFEGIDLAAGKQAIYLWTSYKLRSGRIVYSKLYFDKQLNQVQKFI